jgi:hypothetical protein
MRQHEPAQAGVAATSTGTIGGHDPGIGSLRHSVCERFPIREQPPHLHLVIQLAEALRGRQRGRSDR